jgi:hypothetical protein
MEKEKSPAFQFYPQKFLADMKVVLMTNQEIGCYMKLICFCWEEGAIPSDIEKIAKLCHEDISAMAQLWIAIKDCFTELSGDPSRLIHPRLEKERKKQEEFRNERAESGKKGAESRWRKGSNSKNHNSENKKQHGSANGLANSSAINKPMAEPIAENGSLSLPIDIKKNSITNVILQKENPSSFDPPPADNQPPDDNPASGDPPADEKKFVLPDWIPRDDWQEFLKFRQRVRKPMTERAKHLAVIDLEKLRNEGYSPSAVINQSILNGWSGLFRIRDANEGGNKSPGNKKTTSAMIWDMSTRSMRKSNGEMGNDAASTDSARDHRDDVCEVSTELRLPLDRQVSGDDK